MMKRLIVAGMMTLLVGHVGYLDTHYSMNAHVAMVTSEVVTFEDTTGQLWDWELEEGESYTKGQSVKLYFTGFETSNRQDDKIVKIRG